MIITSMYRRGLTCWHRVYSPTRRGCAGRKEKMTGERIAILEKFLKVKKPKGMNYIEWIEKLYEMETEWEEEHQQPFPI